MALSTQMTPGRIFISYRRDETAFPASWLYERLAAHFGPDQVFKDVDSIELGDDFAEVIADAVGACDVLLVLIGAHWLGVTDEAGHRRLEDSDDFVRLEIEAALQRKVRVIPILVERARMPQAHELPASLGKLVHRQALELDPNRFEADTRRLLRVVEKTLAEEEARREAETRRETETRQETEARQGTEARREAEEASRQSEADQQAAQADEERQRQEPPEETQRPVLPPAKFVASAQPVEATEADTTVPIQSPPSAPPGGVPAGDRPARRRLVAGLVLAGLLAAGAVAYTQFRPDGDGEVPTSSASTGPTATSSPTTPSDEVCTNDIKSNPRWVCLTSAVFANGKLTVKYHAEYAGSKPDIHRGYHLHLYGSDGKNPPDYTMGTQVPKSQQGNYYWVAQEPAILSTYQSKTIARYPKVCARIAVASHGLVHDKNGGYNTGNCVKITKS